MKSIVITGASSGIGQATAFLLAKQGYRVFATVRKEPDAVRLPAGITPILLDLHDGTGIERAAAELPGELYALVNNAGHNYISPFEHFSQAPARGLMETNFFGLVSLTQKLIPKLRAYHEAHPGESARIVNISSIGGLIGIPWESFYHASKFAVVGLTESLRHELWNEGIRATVVCPGGIRTPFIAKTVAELEAAAEGGNRYRASLEKLRSLSGEVNRLGSAPEKVAEAIGRLLRRGNPPYRVLVGPDAKLMYGLSRLLPTTAFHTLMRSVFV